MAHKYDPEFLTALQAMMAATGPPAVHAAHDVEGRRANLRGIFGPIISGMPDSPSITQTRHTIKSYDDAEIPVLHFTPNGTAAPSAPGPAVIHVHGGGMIYGEVDVFAKAIALSTASIGHQVFAPDYRVAPEYPHPNLVEDVYATVTWVQKNAKELNIDPERIAIMGESAGGGIAAGVGLMARDRGLVPALAKLILIYPQLDDRNLTPIESIEPFAVWKCDDNITAWSALLGKDKAGGPDTSPYAAPARAKDLKGLPPTYIDVGELDIFVAEDTEFAMRLMKAGVTVELHVYPGVPHAFEALAPTTAVTARAMGNRFAAAKDVRAVGS